MSKEKFIVVWDGEASCSVESSEDDAKNTIHKLIQHGHDKEEIFVYETTSVKSVKIVIE